MEEEKTSTIAMVEPMTTRKRRKVGRCSLANSAQFIVVVVILVTAAVA